MGRTVPLLIESLVHGGEGLARHEGQVVFVRGGVPGDQVEVELPEATGERFRRGRLLRVLAAGPQRVAAPCPIVESCGGCPLQFVGLEHQMAAKQALVADALHRVGGFDLAALDVKAIVPSPRPFRYRRRARLHRAAGGRWGFSAAASAEIIPVEACMLLEEPLQALLDQVVAAIEAVGGLPDVLDVGLDTNDAGRGSIDLRTERTAAPGLRRRTEDVLGRVRALRGATLGPRGSAEVLGDPVLADAPLASSGGPRLRTRADLFAQANRAAVPLLRAAVEIALGDAAGGNLLEIFCGSGTLTLPLLGKARSLVGIEGSQPALGLLRRSAEEAGLAGPARGAAGSAGPRLRLVAGDAARAMADVGGAHAAGARRFDAAILDPPRTGAGSVLRSLLALRIPRLVYVSCDAPTFARDAAQLVAGGYALGTVTPLDLFPQTAHLELVARFDRLG